MRITELENLKRLHWERNRNDVKNQNNTEKFNKIQKYLLILTRMQENISLSVKVINCN